MVQKSTTSATSVYGPEAAASNDPPPPAAVSAAPSYYDSPSRSSSIGSFRVGDTKMYGVERMPLGGNSTLSVGATPMRGGGAGIRFNTTFKKGGKVKKAAPKKLAKGGKVSSASKRADGCATKGKTKGRFV